VLGGPEVEGQVAELGEGFTEDGGCSVIAAQAPSGGQRIVRAEGDVVKVDHEAQGNWIPGIAAHMNPCAGSRDSGPMRVFHKTIECLAKERSRRRR